MRGWKCCESLMHVRSRSLLHGVRLSVKKRRSLNLFFFGGNLRPVNDMDTVKL
jgi:hypothetical protein